MFAVGDMMWIVGHGVMCGKADVRRGGHRLKKERRRRRKVAECASRRTMPLAPLQYGAEFAAWECQRDVVPVRSSELAPLGVWVVSECGRVGLFGSADAARHLTVFVQGIHHPSRRRRSRPAGSR
jgi:hypothetical protein